jgi:hypothetical protein
VTNVPEGCSPAQAIELVPERVTKGNALALSGRDGTLSVVRATLAAA